MVGWFLGQQKPVHELRTLLSAAWYSKMICFWWNEFESEIHPNNNFSSCLTENTASYLMNHTERVNTLFGKMKSFLDAFEKLRKMTISLVMSVRPPEWNSAPTGRIFMKFYIWVFFENQLRMFNFDLYLTRIMGTVQKGLIHICDISLNFLLRMRNVSDQIFLFTVVPCFLVSPKFYHQLMHNRTV
jgi:hypothetical protein